MKIRILSTVTVILLFAAGAAPARADVTLTPFIGGLFGGNLPTNKPAYGFSLAGMGAGVFGGEFDFSWTPGFVKATPTSSSITEANATGNLIVGIPIGGTHGASVRPYVVGGGGLIRASQKSSDLATSPVSSNDFGWDVGGGILGTFTTHVGLRGDVRYFRSNKSGGGFNFWRGSGGVAFKF